MEDAERKAKNRQIAESMNKTFEKRKGQVCRVYTVKIQENKLSKVQQEQLKMMFVEAKWLKNDIIAWTKQNPERKISDYDTKQKTITHKDKDMNDVEVELKYLPAQVKQCVQREMIANIRTAATLEKKGLQKAGHLKFVTYIDRDKTEHKETNGKTIGIDFGCQTTLTLSSGEKINVQVRESERIKRLSRRLNRRQKKGSGNWYRTVRQLRKQYRKQTNRKSDMANKIVAKLNEYERIVIQDEQLHSWHKGGHGKAVQHSVMGTVKAKLKLLPKTVVLDRSVPTTKLCTRCGRFHDEMKLWDRTFRCSCGTEMDRDVHAARNMVWFYENNVGVGRTNLKRVEMEALVNSVLKTESANFHL